MSQGKDAGATLTSGKTVLSMFENHNSKLGL